MNKDSKIYIAGHNGMVGSAIKRKLEEEGYKNIIFRSSSELDLEDQKATEEFFLTEKPEYVFIAAAKVGGIYANNTYRAEFIYKNLQIQNNLIHFSWKYRVRKLLFLASNCIYPKDCLQPMKEEHLLSGYLEPTNEPYAVAKIAGIKMCEAYKRQYGINFISATPANLFGPNDDYDSRNSHLIAALIRKFHEAKTNNKDKVILWGTGTPRREVMYVDDLAEACLFLMQNYDSLETINVGTGEDMTIKEIAELVKEVVGFRGEVMFDTTKPDGMVRKLLDISKINRLGWKAKTDLKEGIILSYNWFITHGKI
jgi:GDP-L-fucose synthase